MVKTPTAVISGFLGSGKTTVISNLIDDFARQGKKIAYIKNEIGETDLDAKLMRGKDIVSKELLNGCICRTLVGPSVSALSEIVSTFKPDGIIIESSGTADPAAMALMLSDHPDVSRDCVLTVVDVVNFEGFIEIDDVVRRQARLTDLIVLNKVELAATDQKMRVVGYIREINEKAPIIEAKQGRINPELIFGSDEQYEVSTQELKQAEDSHHHLEEDQIQAQTFSSEEIFDEQKFTKLLESGVPKQLFRIKGFVHFSEGIFVVNYIAGRWSLEKLQTPAASQPSTQLICIGYKINEIWPNVKNLFIQLAEK